MTKTVDIWWNIRHELLQGVLNTIDSMCARLSVYFPGNTKEDEEAKETILRYGVLSVKLLFKVSLFSYSLSLCIPSLLSLLIRSEK